MKPDLIVLARELPEVQLVAEVKVGAFDRAVTERQLKRYMLARNCPLALLITPETTWLLRDSYEGSDEASIYVAGEYATSDLLDLNQVPTSERELTSRLHDWLEALAASGHPKFSRANTRDDVARYLLPAVVEGRVFTEMQQ
jgi:hypothetical protein